MTALDGFLTGTTFGDGNANVTVTPNSAADDYVRSIPDGPSADEAPFDHEVAATTNGEEWARPLRSGWPDDTITGWRVGPAAHATLIGTPAPPAFDSTSARLSGGGLDGC